MNRLSTDSDLHFIWNKALDRGADLDLEERDRLGRLLFQLFGALNNGYESVWLDSLIEDYATITTNMRLKHVYN